MLKQPSPADLGYTMPAEWEDQRAVLLSWPLNPATWEDRRNEVEIDYAGFAAAISRFEDVKINCVRAEQPRVRKLLSDTGADAARIELLDVPTNDAWCRDHGPAFLLNRNDAAKRAMVNWNHNAWGGKYPYELDTEVPVHIAKYLGMEMFSPNIVMEGGSIEVNGCGDLITTTSCQIGRAHV